MKKILIFGATGMVGQGVLRECLAAEDVAQVTVVGRSPLAQQHAKLQQLLQNDLSDLQPLAAQLQGYDACLFCLGVTSSGLSEAQYSRLTYDLTLNTARLLSSLNPQMTFIYVSGVGTDSSEKGRSMWARVKGRTENDLQKLPFRAALLFRPGIIQPLHGIRSKTKAYQLFYDVFGPVLTLVRRLFPNALVTTEDLGNAMLNGVRYLKGNHVLEPKDIAVLSRRTAE